MKTSLIKYRVSISFVPEETEATHYFSVEDIDILHYSKNATEESVMHEIFNWLKINYHDRTIQSVGVRKVSY